jgi:hypothetical protein
VARRIESYLLDGPAGKLEALLEEPEERPRMKRLCCAIRTRFTAVPCTTRLSIARPAHYAGAAR